MANDNGENVPYTNGSALLDSHETRIQKLEDSTSTLLQRSAEAAVSLGSIASGLTEVKNKLDEHDSKFENLNSFVQNLSKVENEVERNSAKIEANKKSRNNFVKGSIIAFLGAGGGGLGHWIWTLISSHIH